MVFVVGGVEEVVIKKYFNQKDTHHHLFVANQQSRPQDDAVIASLKPDDGAVL
jgi:hypothetical protein